MAEEGVGLFCGGVHMTTMQKESRMFSCDFCSEQIKPFCFTCISIYVHTCTQLFMHVSKTMYIWGTYTSHGFPPAMYVIRYVYST